MTEFVNRQQRRAAQRHLAKVAKGTKKHPYPEHKRRPLEPTGLFYSAGNGANEIARRLRQIASGQLRTENGLVT